MLRLQQIVLLIGLSSNAFASVDVDSLPRGVQSAANSVSIVPAPDSPTINNDSVGATGSAVPTSATLIGAKDSLGVLRAISSDASGQLNINVVSSALPNGAATETTLVTVDTDIKANQPRTVYQGTSPWVTTRDWTLGFVGDSVTSYQGTSPWLTSRDWTLLNSTDSVDAVQSGTWTVQQGTPPWSVVGTGTTGSPAGNILSVQGTANTDKPVIVAGSATVGSPPINNPVGIAGIDGSGNKRIPLTDTSGKVQILVNDTVGTGISAGYGSAASGLRVDSQLGNTAGAADYNYGTVGAQTLRVAAQAGNATGANDYNNGVAGTQTPRVAIANDSVPTVNRTDVSSNTVSSSGNSSTFDSAGFASANFNFNVSAISGSGAYIQFHVQKSDDGSNWQTDSDTLRLTTTGITRIAALRQASRYYRFTWDVAGSTPSVTFSIVTTLKQYEPDRFSVRYLYSDIDLTAKGNASTTFLADGCRNIALLFIRASDGGNNGTVQLFASNDAVNWISLSGNLAANPGTTNEITETGLAWRYYQLQVTANTNAGTRVLDTQWSCN